MTKKELIQVSVSKGLLLPGRILLSWFSAGSLLTGGYLVAYGLFNELIAHYYLLYTIAGLYIFGGILGILSGGALGMFGRPISMKIKSALKDQLKGLLYAIPAAGVGFVISGWIGLTYWAVYSGSLVAIGFVTASWMISAVIIALAIEFGGQGIKNIFKRIQRLAAIRVRVEFKEIEV